MLDNIIAMRVIYKLVTPFKETAAFRFGIIDVNGKPLRKINDLKTSEEKNAYSMLDRMVFKLKRLLAKLPGGESKLTNVAAAYFLVKENYDLDVSEEELSEQLAYITEKQVVLVEETIDIMSFLELFEDAPVNSTGPAVSSDEPVIKPKKKKQFTSVSAIRKTREIL